MNFGSQLLDADSGEIIVANLEVADTFWKRFRGLQFHRPLAPNEGLLLAPCRSIHTHWMWFPIDVVMLDREGHIIAFHREIVPWKTLRGPHGTHAIVEVASQSPIDWTINRRLVSVPVPCAS
ncbi:MAG: DUF192 domain-containing protein [Planctomycetales bacterium]|nr:DUF192 domain-containing protein [Planctomycetales bacterium]